MNDPIFELLGKLQVTPALYIGSHSAEKLFMYLCGYKDALRDHSDFDISRYQDFIEYLYAKYGMGGGGHSWAWVLGQAAGGDAEGLDLFFAEMKAFQQSIA